MGKREETKPGAPPLLEPGRNCWRIEQAGHVAVIVDALCYFRELKLALESARKQILMIGWDFDTRIGLETPDAEEDLGAFMTRLARARPELCIHILKWNVGALKILGRGLMGLTVIRWMANRRITLKLDSAHPTGASHHQKIIVIDGTFAFCGGIDVTSGRWDDSRHLDDNPDRQDPTGKPYMPWHDATVAVDGDAARALRDLSLERWKTASGKTLPVVDEPRPWPLEAAPMFKDVPVGIARTRGAYKEIKEVRESEALFVDMIAAAKRWIYAENQYLGSRLIARAIALRLQEEDPPEIVLVMPEHADGWLEQVAMDTARDQLTGLIARVDTKRRFRIYHPFTAGGTPIYVHAKLAIVDGRLLRVGSSNLNNRSMGFDSECDLALDAAAANDPQVEATILALRTRLLAEHLGAEEKKVRASLEAHGLIGTIERLRGEGRTLRPYAPGESSELADFLARENILDPPGEEPPTNEAIARAVRWWRRRE